MHKTRELIWRSEASYQDGSKRAQAPGLFLAARRRRFLGPGFTLIVIALLSISRPTVTTGLTSVEQRTQAPTTMAIVFTVAFIPLAIGRWTVTARPMSIK